jgi:ribonuclease P protein component
MFSATERLSRSAFTEFFKSGRRFQTSGLTLVYSPASHLQVSAVVGKKVSKLAVGRNRIRRRIYAEMRRSFTAMGVKKGVYIVIAKPEAARVTRLALAEEVQSLLALPPKAR